MKLTSIFLIGLLVLGALARGPGDACYDACEKREKEAGQSIDAVIYHTCIWECDEKESKINFGKIINGAKKIAPLILKEEQEQKINFGKIINGAKKIAPLILKEQQEQKINWKDIGKKIINGAKKVLPLILSEQQEQKINFGKIINGAKKIAPLILKSEEPLDEIKFKIIIHNALQQTADNTDVIKGSKIAEIAKIFADLFKTLIPKIKEEFKTIPATKEEAFQKFSTLLLTEFPAIMKDLNNKFGAEAVAKYAKYILPLLLN